MFRRIAVAAVAVSLTTFAIAADAAFSGVEKGHVKVEGVAKPGLGAFSGEVDGVSVKEEGGKLIFTADLEDRLKMGLRQDHCKKAFETSKHRSVKLAVDKSKLKLPADNEKASGEVTGDLTLHGVTKPVKVKYTVARTGSDYHIKEAKFSFNYTDFGVEKICKIGVCVEPTVSITVNGVKVRDKS